MRLLTVLAAVALLVGACTGGTSAGPSATTAAPGATAPIPTPTTPGSPGPSGTGPLEPTPSGGASGADTFDPSKVDIGLQKVVAGLSSPIFATGSGDGSGRLFIVEQTGKIRLLGPDGTLAAQPFLDLSGIVSCCGERGLLGLAFSPAYAQDGRFFVDYTDTAGNTAVAVYTRADADHADPSSGHVLLHVTQPYSNHNGGMIAFGPDGDLYVALGDGGSEGDPRGNGQDQDTLLGKLLRLDVSTDPYTVPANNPYVGRSGTKPEIFETGLRNPWRFSFDQQTGDLFIGDVGQDHWEEIDAVAAGTAGGLNFGWKIMEGTTCYDSANCDHAGLTLPIYTYSHDFGCAVIGGYVYRGSAYPALDGGYLFSDECSGRIWAMNAATAVAHGAGGGGGASGAAAAGAAAAGAAGAVATGAAGAVGAKVVYESGLSVSSLGQDDAGELYLCDLGGGTLYRITADAH